VIRQTFAVIALATALGAGVIPTGVAEAQQATVLTYIGTIGENTRMGPQTFTITAGAQPNSYTMQGRVDLDFNIKVMLFSTHVINKSQYTEQWVNGKLVSFKGTTNDRGDQYNISFDTAGGKPMVSATKGNDKPSPKEVSPDIGPASFWLEAYFMKQPRPQYISTNSGKVKSAKPPKMEGQQTVSFRGQQVKVNYYTMDFDGEKYEFWYLADSGLLYKRAEPSEGGKVVFTLESFATK
jgi:hypothetical protein